MERERNSQYVLSKLTSLLSGSGGNNEGNHKQYWMPDSRSVECYDCSAKFTSFRRRHHCRICGQVFCSKCCNNYIPGKTIGLSGNQRVCTFCHGFYLEYQDREAIGGASSLAVPGASSHLSEENTNSLTAPSSTIISFRRNSGDLSLDTGQAGLSQSPILAGGRPASASSAATLGRKQSSSVDLYGSTGVGDGAGNLSSSLGGYGASGGAGSLPMMEAGRVAGASGGAALAGTDEDFSGIRSEVPEIVTLKDPAALVRLWERILDPEVGLRRETHRYYFRSYQDTFKGIKLVDWLVGQDNTTNTSRSQAVAIGQALLSAGFFVSISSGQTSFSDSAELFQPSPNPPALSSNRSSQSGLDQLDPPDQRSVTRNSGTFFSAAFGVGSGNSNGGASPSPPDVFLQEPSWLQDMVESPFATSDKRSSSSGSSSQYQQVVPRRDSSGRTPSKNDSGSSWQRHSGERPSRESQDRTRSGEKISARFMTTSIVEKARRARQEIEEQQAAQREATGGSVADTADRAAVEAGEAVLNSDISAMDSAYMAHEANYLQRLADSIEFEGRSGSTTASNNCFLTPEWSKILRTLADQAVRTVVPDLRYLEEMDIRDYVKVKCVEGGKPSDSRLVDGEVFTQQLAHKDMPNRISDPKIALVANSIVFQREENKMISLDTLMMQEEEYIKNVVDKLLQSKPTVVLVEKTVSRLAQDIFLRQGVSLALNVKTTVLRRLERLTRANIISSIDSMVTQPQLGTSTLFYTKRTKHSYSRSRGLMVFEGCSPELGGTIIIQGESRPTLVRLKAVLKRLLLLKYSWKHEKSFILNEYGWICKEESTNDDDQDEERNGEKCQTHHHLAISPFIKVKVEEPNSLNKSDLSDDIEVAISAGSPSGAKDAISRTQSSDDDKDGGPNGHSDGSPESRDQSTGVGELSSNEGIATSSDKEKDESTSSEDSVERAVNSITIQEDKVADEDGILPQSALHTNNRAKWCQQFIESKDLHKPLDESPEIRNSLALFRASGWRKNPPKTQFSRPGANGRRAPIVGVLPAVAPAKIKLPMDHCELVSVLFSSYSATSNVAPECCVKPWIVNMGLYGAYDITLGGFLESFCFSPNYHCPNRQCSTPIVDHVRRFCHSGVAVSVHIQRIEVPVMEECAEKLMMWKYCTECQLITPIVPVTEETWSLSFAMFLHLLFHDNKLKRRGADRPDAKCTHSLHQEHLTCFGKDRAVATFKLTKLQLLQVVAPPHSPSIPPPSTSKSSLLSKLCNLKQEGSAVYSSVLEKLHEMKKGETFDIVDKRMVEQEEEFKKYRERVELLEEEITSKEEHNIDMLLKLNILHRDLIITQVQWNKRLYLLTQGNQRKRGFSGQSQSSSIALGGQQEQAAAAMEAVMGSAVSAGGNAGQTAAKNSSSSTPVLSEPQGITSPSSYFSSNTVTSPQSMDSTSVIKRISNILPTGSGGQAAAGAAGGSGGSGGNGFDSGVIGASAERGGSLGSASLISSSDCEQLLKSPFPRDTHLITGVAGQPADPPLPHLVLETEPSTIIHYMLQSQQYMKFLRESTQDGAHFELQFSSDSAQFYCCSYFTKEFHQLRDQVFPGKTDNFIHSLASSRRWEAMGGKSGLLFFKTKDDRFILKQMSRFESQSLGDFAPHYFKYVEQCIENKTTTLLGKIFGVFKIGFKNSASGTGLKMDILIIENLFYQKKVDKSYDLKGSTRNRLTNTGGKEDITQVLLDENLVREAWDCPIYVNARDKTVLVEAITRDTTFLAQHQMMDYSLLTGICRKSGELVVGIIDYIRTFTWDKKLETLVKSVKSSGVFGGPAKTPTVVNPELYRERFAKAMDSYFLLVPD